MDTANQVTEPLLTCAAVVMAFGQTGLVRMSFNMAEHISQIAALAEKYADQAPDQANLCFIRMSELHPRHRVITTDVTDFSVYRQGPARPDCADSSVTLLGRGFTASHLPNTMRRGLDYYVRNWT